MVRVRKGSVLWRRAARYTRRIYQVVLQVSHSLSAVLLPSAIIEILIYSGFDQRLKPLLEKGLDCSWEGAMKNFHPELSALLGEKKKKKELKKPTN